MWTISSPPQISMWTAWSTWSTCPNANPVEGPKWNFTLKTKNKMARFSGHGEQEHEQESDLLI
jgi:hypothetical protein